jgi:uncharacterized protein YgiM (DUF1202 family)
MKTVPRHALLLVVVFLGTLSLAAVQEATVKRNVNLRSDPSTDNPAIELLQANSTVTLLGPAPQNGYYHVKAEDGQQGWVWGRNISLAAETGEPPSPPSTQSTTPTPPSAERQGPPELYPDAIRTKGASNPDISQDNIADNICNKTWSTRSVRPPVSYTNSLKGQQMTEYGDTVSDTGAVCPFHSDNRKCYEEDHLIALEDGGNPKDQENLWPEPYDTEVNGKIVGAHQKDIVEGFIHDEICFTIPGSKKNSKIPAHTSITLQRGQEILATDWYACYLSIQNGENCR